MAEAVSSTKPSASDTDDEPRRSLPQLSLIALGVVFGDIGTSPLYAFRECFHGVGQLSPTTDNVYGVLSLIVWSLVIVIALKYLTFVMRADNGGEGGIVALIALLNPWRSRPGTRRYRLMLLGLFGAALLYGDSTITPAISVLSAIEGVKVATSAFDHLVIPVTIGILLGLFILQQHGTAKIGTIFGPVMLLWFFTLALLGLGGIAQHPLVLLAVNPLYAVRFVAADPAMAFTVMGAVFLVVTGGEMLYADMGHFGPQPVRLAWFALVMPALLLNYLGQGAQVLVHPPSIAQPFYALAPSWSLYPLVALATLATVIASQAVISGTFSMTSQLVQLDQLPRMRIIHTHGQERGQVYLPAANWLLMVATIGLVLGFQSSDNLASAYGIAVAANEGITTVLAFFVALRWGWNIAPTGALAAAFLTVDLTFFAANILKIEDGGWYPVTAAILIFTLIATWHRGRQLLTDHINEDTETLAAFVDRIDREVIARSPGVGVFMVSSASSLPPMLRHHVQHNKAVQETVLLLTVETLDVPRVPSAERLTVKDMGHGFWTVVARYGFMQSPNVPVALRFCERFGLKVDPDKASFYVGRAAVIPSPDVAGMMLWRERLFAVLSNNAQRATAYYNITPERVVELGMQIRI